MRGRRKEKRRYMHTYAVSEEHKKECKYIGFSIPFITQRRDIGKEIDSEPGALLPFLLPLPQCPPAHAQPKPTQHFPPFRTTLQQANTHTHSSFLFKPHL